MDAELTPHYSRTEQAVRRLEGAVARLQAAIETRASRDAGLARELAAARADYAALREVTREVSGRLDSAILRVKSMVEG